MTENEISKKYVRSTPALTKKHRILGGLWGSLVGDALGVPVEFRSRAEIQKQPVTGMREHGTHHQPKGTWSDDGALILCTVDSLVHAPFDTQDMGRRFVRWMNDAQWSATGVVFDIGLATSDALMRVAGGIPAEEAGGRDERSNGNGSLMRIIPVALRFADEPLEAFANRIERVSAITHGHDRSKMACVFFSLVVRRLLQGLQPEAALKAAREEFINLYKGSPEFARFSHQLNDDFSSMVEEEIVSTGYVLHTLHAALWCLLTTDGYPDCALRAVNLGGDTDTTGCVAGGLAGVAYGVHLIPRDWVAQLPHEVDLDRLFECFCNLCCKDSMAGVSTK
jgi:ADP-ribosyl-[dinitrogen reductase] hydrolase